MGVVASWVMTPKSITEEGNKMKEIFLSAMEREGIITNEQVNKMNEYCFVIAEKGFFGNLWDKRWKKDSTAVKIIVVKVLDQAEEVE